MCTMAQNTSEHQQSAELLRNPIPRTSVNKPRLQDGLYVRADRAHKTEWHAQEVLVNGQLVQERERVVERLEQVLVVLDHLAAHVDAQPLLVAVQFVAIENVS